MPNTNIAQWLLVLLCLPGQPPKPAGILLLDLNTDYLGVKLKNDILLEDEMVSAFWSGLELTLKKEASEKGGLEVVRWLEMTASHSVEVSARNHIELTSDSYLETLESLYRKHVETAAGFH